MSTASPPYRTLADFLNRVGNIPLDRIRFDPAPGTATVQDVAEILSREGRACELVNGVLLEKTAGYRKSTLALFLSTLLNNFVLPRDLGFVSGADGTVELFPALVRVPDVAFISWNRLPEGRIPTAPVPAIVPELVVKVLSQSNTPGEMRVKRSEYFSAGVQIVWEIDPGSRTATVYTPSAPAATLQVGDALNGSDVLPGFRLPLADLFAFLDRKRQP